jgi:hypothetical protein
MIRFRKKSKYIGAVIEFGFDDFIAYGLCTHDLSKSGQIVKLFAPKCSIPISNLDEIRNFKSRMFVRLALEYLPKKSPVEVIGHVKLLKNEKMMPKFRSVGLSAPDREPEGWWIVEGDKETWVKFLDREMATYSEDGIFSLKAVEEVYEQDLFPTSRQFLRQGPLNFDPDIMN